MSKSTELRIILENIDHESSAGTHTVHRCDCLPESSNVRCRRTKCVHCWQEDLAKMVGPDLASDIVYAAQAAARAYRFKMGLMERARIAVDDE